METLISQTAKLVCCAADCYSARKKRRREQGLKKAMGATGANLTSHSLDELKLPDKEKEDVSSFLLF